MRMLLQGLLLINAFILHTACSFEKYYAISHPPLSSNLTCERDNIVYEPCGTLERLHTILYSYQTNSTSIYLLDSKYRVSRDILFNFSSLKSVEIKTWNRSKSSLIICSNHDFSAHFFNIEKIIVESVSFRNCGKSKPTLLSTGTITVTQVQINSLSFVRSSQNSILIQSDVIELQVTDCFFSKGKAIAVFIQSDSVSNASFNNVSFCHDNAGSIRIDSTSSHVSELVLSYCNFFYSSTNESIIEVNLLYSVTIKYSFFSDNSVRNILLTRDTKQVIITESYIDRNTAYSSTIHCSNSLKTIDKTEKIFIWFVKSSLVIVRNTSAYNNTNVNNSSILNIQSFERTIFLNCIFKKNKGVSSQLIMIYEAIINQTVFEENNASALPVLNSNNLTINYCKFISNIAESGGAIYDILEYGSRNVVIQGSIFINNQAKHNGGSINIYANEIKVISSEFFNNSALEGDGGAMNISGNLYITSSSFMSNRALNGRAISMNKGSLVDLQNTTFTDNHAENGSGGAIVSTHDASIKINNCRFINNIALKDGGGVLYTYATELTVSLNNFTNNSAENGGAVNIVVEINVTILQSTFTNNTGLKNGGAICLHSDNVNITHCYFHDNFAANGGGVSADGMTYLTIEMTGFYFNRANVGAGLEILHCHFIIITDSQFILNIATEYNGGAMIIKGNKNEFHNCNFQENTALSPEGKGGPINVISLAVLIVNHTNFTANAAHHGGALNIENTLRVIVWDCYFINNSANLNGGAIVMANNNSEVNLYDFSKFISNDAKNGGALAFNAIGFFSTLTYSCSNNTGWLDNSIKEATLCFHHHHSSNFGSLSRLNITVITNCSFTNNEACARKKEREELLQFGGTT